MKLIYHGEETYLRDKALEKLKRDLVPPGLEAFNYERLEGNTLTPDILRAAVETVPVMCERRLVVVRDYDLYKGDEKTQRGLLTVLTDFPDTACLVFVYDTLVYKRDKRVKLHAEIEKQMEVVCFERQKGYALERFVREEFQGYGKRIEASEIDYLTHRCGDLMATLHTEIGKIAHYASGEAITRQDIDAVGTPMLSAVVFDLTDALAARRHPRAMELLMEMRQMREEPIMILGAIGKNMRGLYAARLCIEHGRGAAEVMEIMGYQKSYPAEKLMKAARSFTLAWCRQAVRACAEADRQLRGGVRDRDRVLEWLLATLAFQGQTA